MSLWGDKQIHQTQSNAVLCICVCVEGIKVEQRGEEPKSLVF